MSKKSLTLLSICCLLLTACGDDAAPEKTAAAQPADPLSSEVLVNPAAYIPPQCYTKTEDAHGGVHNPCYTCHTNSRPPNYINDHELQLAFDFAEPAATNRWTNLFKDRSAEVAAQSDDEILAYVRYDNYLDEQGHSRLAAKLDQLPAAWDHDGDGQWSGYYPDCHFNFDEAGFDHAPDGSLSGWRAFAYYTFPGTFWPTNGSTDDVLIRLPAMFRQDEQGDEDLSVYKLNLAVVEALIKHESVAIEPVYEPDYRVDLNGDGEVAGMADQVTYRWDIQNGKVMDYVGMARLRLQEGAVHIAPGLYPEGTEFLHTVRYLDLDEEGRVRMAARMKELRYGKKLAWFNYSDLFNFGTEKLRERATWPDRLDIPRGNAEVGLSNNMGWVYQGFIEDAGGELRPQSLEENYFCIGCHSGIGVITDSTFAFPRKVPANTYRGGWYHWAADIDADPIPEPRRADGQPEFAFYLEHNGAADELRENHEAYEKFFLADGTLKPEMLEALRFDVNELLHPSPRRALDMNKAYRVIVREQSFVEGRDATIVPAVNVHDKVEVGQPTGVTEMLLTDYL